MEKYFFKWGMSCTNCMYALETREPSAASTHYTVLWWVYVKSVAKREIGVKEEKNEYDCAKLRFSEEQVIMNQVSDDGDVWRSPAEARTQHILSNPDNTEREEQQHHQECKRNTTSEKTHSSCVQR